MAVERELNTFFPFLFTLRDALSSPSLVILVFITIVCCFFTFQMKLRCNSACITRFVLCLPHFIFIFISYAVHLHFPSSSPSDSSEVLLFAFIASSWDGIRTLEWNSFQCIKYKWANWFIWTKLKAKNRQSKIKSVHLICKQSHFWQSPCKIEPWVQNRNSVAGGAGGIFMWLGVGRHRNQFNFGHVFSSDTFCTSFRQVPLFYSFM